MIYAVLSEDAHTPLWANVIANTPDGPLTLKIQLNNENSLDGQLIHRYINQLTEYIKRVQCHLLNCSLAAKKLIQQLQDKDPDHPETKKEIIQLGCRYGTKSSFFV